MAAKPKNKERGLFKPPPEGFLSEGEACSPSKNHIVEFILRVKTVNIRLSQSPPQKQLLASDKTFENHLILSEFFSNKSRRIQRFLIKYL